MTFSIVARDSRTGALGTAVTTTVTCVGALAPHVSRDAAVSTQAYVNVDLGLATLELVAAGETVEAAMRGALARDHHVEQRQLVGIGASGEGFAFTGSEVLADSGHLVADDHAVAGNLLVSTEVLEAMSRAFASSDGEEFTSRLIGALEAGLAAGGERDSSDFAETYGSAAVLVASPEPKGFHNLRVDASLTAVADLRSVYERAVESARALDEFYAGAIVVNPVHWRRSALGEQHDA
ncbi:DUF1028 domain-containing protein [Microbacterium immunditiarum]|uniref:Putative Ntn-hydrolase superfamily protein n=1 Tax=Microbacterium immunditiarum TaxID=337480 RepID=A0A7Y9GPZ2_9MICO|nr:DUF1028 domain-containing protein [Microbacterium immunditiarum]NYE19400.1 putative Ntn-hydrolase superfamily protein [Microbacterium immunditiarum]